MTEQTPYCGWNEESNPDSRCVMQGDDYCNHVGPCAVTAALENNPDSDAIERVKYALDLAADDDVFQGTTCDIKIADLRALRALLALAKPTSVMVDAAQRTPYCPNCGGGCVDDWHFASRLQHLSAEVVRFTAEMVRRDENENWHCLNYGPCSRMDQHQGDV